MEDFFKFILVLVSLCIAVNIGYFENTDNVPVGTVIETKISAKDKMTDKEKENQKELIKLLLVIVKIKTLRLCREVHCYKQNIHLILKRVVVKHLKQDGKN